MTHTIDTKVESGFVRVFIDGHPEGNISTLEAKGLTPKAKKMLSVIDVIFGQEVRCVSESSYRYFLCNHGFCQNDLQRLESYRNFSGLVSMPQFKCTAAE